MGFELTIASTSAVTSALAFILGWTYYILYKPIINERDKILPRIKKDFLRLIEKYKKHQDNKNFIRDLLGLYVFEIRLKEVERYFRNLFVGFVTLLMTVLLTALIYDIFGFHIFYFIPIFFILEIEVLSSYLSFSNLWVANISVEKYKRDVLPRELIKVKIYVQQ